MLRKTEHKDLNIWEILKKKTLTNEEIAEIETSLKNKANIEERNNLGNTLLHFAARNGHLEVVRLLIENGANIEVKNNDDQTPLFVAAGKGYFKVVQLLIENGADIEAKDNYGNTSLSMAAEHGHLEVVQLLIENGADIHAKDNDGWTPLHVAVLYGYFELVQLLIEKGADIEAKNNSGRTPLHVAAVNGHFKVVQLLIENGADIEVKNNSDETPLYLAAWQGYSEMMQLMIEQVEINLPKEEIIKLISDCIKNHSGEKKDFDLSIICDLEKDFKKNRSIILEHYEKLKKSIPLNLLINLKNICTDPKNKKILTDLYVKNKPLTPFENRLNYFTSNNTALIGLTFLASLRQENEGNQKLNNINLISTKKK